MRKNAVIIQHVAFEDAGSFHAVLQQQEFTCQMHDATLLDWASIDPLAADLWLVLGGPIGVYEQDDYPFLTAEIAALQQRLAADKPTLGICLGAQLMATALGAQVYPSGHKEIGWLPLQLTPGADNPLADLADMPVLHWHGDMFDIPEGATCLAATALCQHQAFSLGNALALQFHLEVTTSGLERWFVGHTHEIAHADGVTVKQLRTDSARYANTLEQAGQRIFKQWLASLKDA
jgi:GMP synthase (glutamine-hydrolysing)